MENISSIGYPSQEFQYADVKDVAEKFCLPVDNIINQKSENHRKRRKSYKCQVRKRILVLKVYEIKYKIECSESKNDKSHVFSQEAGIDFLKKCYHASNTDAIDSCKRIKIVIGQVLDLVDP